MFEQIPQKLDPINQLISTLEEVAFEIEQSYLNRLKELNPLLNTWDTLPKNRTKTQQEILDKSLKQTIASCKDDPLYYELFLRLLRLKYRGKILKHFDNSRYVFYHQLNLHGIAAKQKSELLELMCELKNPNKPELRREYGLVMDNGTTKLCYGASRQEVVDLAHSANLRELSDYPDLKDFYKIYFIDFKYPSIVEDFITEEGFFRAIIDATKISFDFVVVDSVYSLNTPRGKGKKDPKEPTANFSKTVLT
jgi:hypothetical protein